MSWLGEPYRVRLTEDLTRYHEHLVVGTEGVLVPQRAFSKAGVSNLFAGVKFDCCGVEIDVMHKGLDIIDERYQERVKKAIESRIAEIKRATSARLITGPRGGVRKLEYSSTDAQGGRITKTVTYKQDIETTTRLLREAGVAVNTVIRQG